MGRDLSHHANDTTAALLPNLVEQALAQSDPPSDHDDDGKPGAGHGARAGGSR